MHLLGTYRLPYGSHTVLASVLVGLALAGCAKPPPPPPPPVTTPMAFTITAGPDANPDVRGRASPITLRVYAFKTTAAFEGADFFTLFEKDTSVLAADTVQREEMLLRPGESKKLQFVLPADAKAWGVMGAYRDLDRARWREVRPVEPGKGQIVTVTVGARQMKIDSVPAPPPPPPPKK
ncbi:type VI secretion system lipoprotein TssJ [Variovorax rhizosphaerae]|uniref:Type VI secretion system lipoprotein TssJ n=1 Tax=Variovorax rhizosphaerae TaxID=1836200 RepID=A0ABU8WP33_9BURK